MHYSEAAVERAMNIQEVRLRAIAKKLTWWQAAEILGLSCRQMRRWKRRYEEHGYNGLFDHRWGKPAPKRGGHRKRRVRRPLPGLLLHIDASTPRWLGAARRYDFLVVMDDATSKVYYAQLVAQEETRGVLRARRQVVAARGLFCALYSD